MTSAFISYAREDVLKAREVYSHLTENGHEAWLDEVELLPGQRWEPEIKKAIKSSDVFIACLSNRSVNKRGIFQKELKQAFDLLNEFPDDDIFIIPLRFENCTVPERFEPIQYLDWFCFEERKKLLYTLSLRENSKVCEKDKFIILQALMELKSKTWYVYPDLKRAVAENKDHTNGSLIREPTLDKIAHILDLLKQHELLDYSLASDSGEILPIQPNSTYRIDKVYMNCIDIVKLQPLIKIMQELQSSTND